VSLQGGVEAASEHGGLACIHSREKSIEGKYELEVEIHVELVQEIDYISIYPRQANDFTTQICFFHVQGMTSQQALT